MEVYIAIYLFLFLLYYLYGWLLCTHKDHYWRYSIIPMAAFIIIEGSRYLRGIDYRHYGLFFSYPELLRVKEDIGFEYLNSFLRQFSNDQHLAFIVYALITICCLFIFVKPFRSLYKIVFVIMLAFIIHPSEWLIRQFISVSIMYAAISKFIEGKYKSFLLLSLIGITIHYSSICLLLFFIGSFVLFKKPISYRVSIPLIILIMLVSSADFVANQISFLLNNIQIPFLGGSSYLTYIDRSDDFLNSKAAGTVTGIRSIWTNLFNLLFYIVTFRECYHLLMKYNDKFVLPIFNLFVIGSLLYEFFLKYELFVRLFQPMELLGFIPVAYVIRNHRQCRYKLSYLYLILFVVLNISRFIFFPAEKYYLFIWDK